MQKSKEPTWLIDLDYKPIPDVLIYAKWARGYRQGGVNPSNIGLETWEPEKVDTYEVGTKASFSGALRGFINIAAFYNDFTNQQLQAINRLGATDRDKATQMYRDYQKQYQERFNKFLTPEQQQAWRQMIGDPFTFQPGFQPPPR